MVEDLKAKDSVDLSEALSQRLTLRAVGPDNKYYEVAMPKEVVEREARRHGLSLDEFRKQFEVEALYNAFAGIHYRFVRKE